MPSRTQYVRHKFGGGWASNLGRHSDVTPDQANQLIIPFVTEANNIFWREDGGFRKVGGTTKINSTTVTNTIFGMFDYHRQGTSGSPSQRLIIHQDTVIMEDGDSGTFINLFTGLESGKVPTYCTFGDLLIISSDSNSDVPKSWDLSTAQDLAGSPPNFAFCVQHKNRLWAAGAAAAPSKLYYSGLGDPTNWTGLGSGEIDIDSDDGDVITGLASYKGNIWIWKGPNFGSIHRITGNSPADFSKPFAFVRGLGAVWHNTIFQFRDDIGFMSPDGTVHSLTATDAFGDFRESSLSRQINDWIDANINLSQLKRVWAVSDRLNSRVYFAVPTGSSATNTRVLVMDHTFEPVRWSYVEDSWNVQSLARYINSASKPVIVAGGTDGFVRETNVAARSIDGSTGYDPLIKTPFMNYGGSVRHKTATLVGVALSPKGSSNLRFKHLRDQQTEQITNFTQTGTGFLLDTDVLDTGTLGGSSFDQLYIDLEEGGEFRNIQYTFTQDTTAADDIELHNFEVGIDLDAVGSA